MYLARIYEWRAVKNFHAAVLLEIERGRLQWGDSFLNLEHRTLTGFAKQEGEGKRGQAAGFLFCQDYQRGKCANSKDHYSQIKGERKWVSHVCANCWIKDKAKKTSHRIC